MIKSWKMWSSSPSFLTNTLWYKCNAFSTLMKLLYVILAITSPVWGVAAKLAWISFPLHNCTERKDSLLPEIWATSAYTFFLSPIKWRTFTFSLKEGIFPFLSGISECQHHYSGASGTLLNKVRATWIPPLRPQGQLDLESGCWLMAGGDTLDKGMIQVLGGRSWDNVRVHHATQKGGHVKRLNCLFLELSI